MKTYTITVKYTAEATYTIEADHEEQAEAMAWNEVNNDPEHATSYGQWELLSIEENEAAQ